MLVPTRACSLPDSPLLGHKDADGYEITFTPHVVTEKGFLEEKVKSETGGRERDTGSGLLLQTGVGAR